MDGRSSLTSSASSGPNAPGCATSMERKAAPSSSMSAACERRHDAVCILHHEEQIEHSDRAVLHELQDRRGDTPGELVARKTNDVDVDGADCHDLSLFGTALRLKTVFERIAEAVSTPPRSARASICRAYPQARYEPAAASSPGPKRANATS